MLACGLVQYGMSKACRSQTVAGDVDRVAAIGVVGLGAEVVVGTLENRDPEPALLGQRRSQRQARRPSTDDRHADGHVSSSLSFHHQRFSLSQW